MRFSDRVIICFATAFLASVPALAGEELKLQAQKEINTGMLAKYQQIPVTVNWQGKKTKYNAVPLRALFKEMLPDIPIDTMPDWKALSKKELLLEVKGSDGYPGLVTATEMAINTSGDKFILVSKHNDKSGKDEVDMICKGDEERVRWVRDVASMRIFCVAKD